MQNRGFTIVELLIVIVVIGILAAITIVAFNGIQERARTSAVQSALSQANKKLAIAMNDGTLSTYPADQAGFDALNISGGSNTTFQYRATPNSTSPTGYCITATNGTTSYKISETGTATSGACAGHGSGGVSAITNLVVNPSFRTNTTGWVQGGATIARVTSPWSADGNGAIQITPTGQDSYVQFSMSTTPGTTYTILGTLNLQSTQTGTFQGPTQQRNIMPTFYNSSNTYLSNGGANSNVSPNTAGTYQHRVTVTAPASSSMLRVRLYNGANTGGGVVYWDQMMIVEGSYSGNYYDGDSDGWTWNGTANNATSTGPPL